MPPLSYAFIISISMSQLSFIAELPSLLQLMPLFACYYFFLS